MTSPSKLGSRFDRAKVRMMPVQVQMIESLARKPAVTMRFSQNSQFLFAENRKKKDWLHLPDRKMWWNLESSFPFCDIAAASVVSISFQGYSFSALKFFAIISNTGSSEKAYSIFVRIASYHINFHGSHDMLLCTQITSINCWRQGGKDCVAIFKKVVNFFNQSTLISDSWYPMEQPVISR